jgi:hypothetical protein
MLCNNKRQILPAAKRYCALIRLSNLLAIVGQADIVAQANTVLSLGCGLFGQQVVKH